jgi:hypothetical protein
MKDQELQAQQRDVQRLLGRCLLRLQQYERLMKAVVAHHDLSGPAHALEKIRAARIDDASTKTLGTLVGQLFGSYVIPAKTDTGIDTTADEPGGCSLLRDAVSADPVCRGLREDT